jgi:uncharacterized membrane protein YhiD involved in acid resistance
MIPSPLEQAELAGRLALAAGLAGVLGWERQLGQQPAGLRTHMLVALGAAAFEEVEHLRQENRGGYGSTGSGP